MADGRTNDGLQPEDRWLYGWLLLPDDNSGGYSNITIGGWQWPGSKLTDAQALFADAYTRGVGVLIWIKGTDGGKTQPYSTGDPNRNVYLSAIATG